MAKGIKSKKRWRVFLALAAALLVVFMVVRVTFTPVRATAEAGQSLTYSQKQLAGMLEDSFANALALNEGQLGWIDTALLPLVNTHTKSAKDEILRYLHSELDGCQYLETYTLPGGIVAVVGFDTENLELVALFFNLMEATGQAALQVEQLHPMDAHTEILQLAPQQIQAPLAPSQPESTAPPQSNSGSQPVADGSASLPQSEVQAESGTSEVSSAAQQQKAPAEIQQDAPVEITEEAPVAALEATSAAQPGPGTPPVPAVPLAHTQSLPAPEVPDEVPPEVPDEPEQAPYTLRPVSTASQPGHEGAFTVELPAWGVGCVRLATGHLYGGALPGPAMTRVAFDNPSLTAIREGTTMRVYSRVDPVPAGARPITVNSDYCLVSSSNYTVVYNLYSNTNIALRRDSTSNNAPRYYTIELHNSQPVTIASLNASALVQHTDDTLTISAKRDNAEFRVVNARPNGASHERYYNAVDIASVFALEGNGKLVAMGADTGRSIGVVGDNQSINQRIILKNGFRLEASGGVNGINTHTLLAQGEENARVSVHSTGLGSDVHDQSAIRLRGTLTAQYADVHAEYNLRAEGRTGGLYAVYAYAQRGANITGRAPSSGSSAVHIEKNLYIEDGGVVHGIAEGASSRGIQAMQCLNVNGGTAMGEANNGAGSVGIVTRYIKAAGGATITGNGGGPLATAGVDIAGEGELYAEGNSLVHGLNAGIGVRATRIITQGGTNRYSGPASATDEEKTRVVGEGIVAGIARRTSTEAFTYGYLPMRGSAIIGIGGAYGVDGQALVTTGAPARRVTDDVTGELYYEHPALTGTIDTMQYGTLVALGTGDASTGYRQSDSTILVTHGVRMVARGSTNGIEGLANAASLTLATQTGGEVIAEGGTYGINWAAQGGTRSATAATGGKLYARGGTTGIQLAGAGGGTVGTTGAGAATSVLYGIGGVSDADMEATALSDPENYAFEELPLPKRELQTQATGTFGAFADGSVTFNAAGVGTQVLLFGLEAGGKTNGSLMANNGGKLAGQGSNTGLQGGSATVQSGGLLLGYGHYNGVSTGTAGVNVTGTNSYLYGMGDNSGVISAGAIRCGAGSQLVGETMAAEHAAAGSTAATPAIRPGAGRSIEAAGTVQTVYNMIPFSILTLPPHPLNADIPAVGTTIGNNVAKLQSFTWTTPANGPGMQADDRHYVNFNPTDDTGGVALVADGLEAQVDATAITLVGNAGNAGALGGAGASLSGNGTFRLILRNVNLGANTTTAFSFTKVDAQNHNTVLEKAVFNLYTCPHTHTHKPWVSQQVAEEGGCWQPVYKDNGEMAEYASDGNGVVDFGRVENGVYMLVEVKAPEGYDVPMGQWQLDFDTTREDEVIIINAVGARLPPAFVSKVLPAGGEALLLPNMKPFVLPKSGAGGIWPHLIIGTLLIILGIGKYRFNRHKKHSNGCVRKRNGGVRS